MGEKSNGSNAEVNGTSEGAARASALLAQRFPTVVHTDLGGEADKMHFHLVSWAEGINESNGRLFLPGPDSVASGFVSSAAGRDWRLVGGPRPGDDSEQRASFAVLADKLASHMERRARDRAANRRQVPSSSDHHEGGLSVAPRPGTVLRTWHGLPVAGEDSGETVVVHLEAIRVIRHLKKSLRSEVQRAFLANLEMRPDLASSLGVHGEGTYLARELGLSEANVRQLLARIRAAVTGLDFDDAA